MAFSKWFWDTFPKRMTALWWVLMVALIIATMFWRDAIMAWGETHIGIVAWAIVGLLILVGAGNYIPGIPSMPLPLLTGWAIAGGFPISLGVFLALLTWLIAYFSSVNLFMKAQKEGNALATRWNLRSSERYGNMVTAVRVVPKIVRKSRIGKFAAYCGHVNIAAGIYGYNIHAFFNEAGWGHFLWVLQYIAIGFAISWLMPYVGKLFQ